MDANEDGDRGDAAADCLRLVADDRRRSAKFPTEELKHFSDWIGNGAGAAPRIEQTHGARTCGHILDHQ